MRAITAVAILAIGGLGVVAYPYLRDGATHLVGLYHASPEGVYIAVSPAKNRDDQDRCKANGGFIISDAKTPAGDRMSVCATALVPSSASHQPSQVPTIGHNRHPQPIGL